MSALLAFVLSSSQSVALKIDNLSAPAVPYIYAYTACFEGSDHPWKTLAATDRKARVEDCERQRPMFIDEAKAKFSHIAPATQLQLQRNLASGLVRVERAYERAIDAPSEK